jgi:hypothetical protein
MAREMLLSGNRLLVIAGVQMAIEPGIGGPETLIAPEMDRIATVGTTFVDVDVSDLAKPTVRESLTVDGSYSSARLTGSTARIVMNSDPLTTIGIRRYADHRATRRVRQHQPSVARHPAGDAVDHDDGPVKRHSAGRFRCRHGTRCHGHGVPRSHVRGPQSQ